jgi:FkbM family methyltransferase
MPDLAKLADTEAGTHVARSFPALPGRERARGLVEEIAAGRFARPERHPDMPIALYGAGNLGRMAREFLRAVWLDCDFVIDRNAAALRERPEWQGATLHAPEEVPEEFKQSHRLLVTVATSPYVPLERQLRDAGFEHVTPFYDFAEDFRHIHPLSNGWYAAPFTELDLRMIAVVLEALGDDLSRAHYLQFLAWRRLRQEWVFDGAQISLADRFFIPEVMDGLGEEAAFLDAGAYHGEVSLAFDDRTLGRWSSITAIEPDAASRAILADAFAARWPADQSPRPTVLANALGAARMTAAFHDGLGYASQLSLTGGRQVDVVPIDALGLEPDFIKLHLEGAELDALKGARQTLLSARPIIAATIYHNDDGIWRTPLWLAETLPGYRLLFRLHSWCGTGAVLYAIPEERARR